MAPDGTGEIQEELYAAVSAWALACGPGAFSLARAALAGVTRLLRHIGPSPYGEPLEHVFRVLEEVVRTRRLRSREGGSPRMADAPVGSFPWRPGDPPRAVCGLALTAAEKELVAASGLVVRGMCLARPSPHAAAAASMLEDAHCLLGIPWGAEVAPLGPDLA